MNNKLILFVFLLFSYNIFSQSLAIDMLIDKYDTEKCSYEFINSKIRIQIQLGILGASKGAVGIFEYNPSDNSFSKVKAFYITESYLFEKDGNKTLVLSDGFEKKTLKYNPKSKKAVFANYYSPQCPQKFTFISNPTLLDNRISSIRKKFIDEQRKKEEERLRKIDAEIGIELDKLVSQNKIKDLSTFRKKINNDVTSEDLKENYLDKINTEIKTHNDKLESEFSKAILDKDPDKVEIVFNDFVEYQDIEGLKNEIIKTFNLENAVLSITSTDNFKDYFINFALSNFPFFTVYNENATVEFKFTNGKFQSSTGHSLNYNPSNIEKKVLKPYILTGVSPKFEPFEIKKVVKLVNLNKFFIHGKKDGQKIYYHEINQKNKEQFTFNGGEYSSSKLVFSKKNFNNSKSIKTKSFESLKELIRENISDTYRFKDVTNSQNYNVNVTENLNSLFSASVRGIPQEGFLSTDKNFVNVYSEWIYELSINDKKINEQVKTKFNSKSGFKNINSILFNKPFYTIDVYRLY